MGNPGSATVAAEPARSLPRDWAELTGRIGRTPMVRVRLRFRGTDRSVLLKLEGLNPLGSVKDRTAYSLLRSLEMAYPGERLTVVESTSGNLGAALAALCHLRGHQFVAVVDPRASAHNLALMRRFHARIETAGRADRTGSFLADRIALVAALVDSVPGAHWTNQYGNPANPAAHFTGTGPEILADTGPAPDHVFVAASTGGTVAGIAAFLRAARPDRPPRIVGVDAVGSVALGGPAHPRHLDGHGASRPSQFVRPGNLDEVAAVADADAVAVCRLLATQAGLRVGGSSGAAVAACLAQLAEGRDPGLSVCVCPDDGAKYADTLYDDAWVRARGIDVGSALAGYAEDGVEFSPPGRP
ncbi:pyridoxal-phosphate dependent enzyme [Amycolatopsis sp. NPDC005003]